MKLYKGQASVAGRKSVNSLFSEALATFGKDKVYRQADATGFINLFGLPLKIQAQLEARKKPRRK